MCFEGLCALRYSLGFKDNEFGRTIFFGTIDTEFTKQNLGAHQKRLTSIRLSDTRSMWSNSLLKKWAAFPTVKNPDKAQPPNDQSKKAIIDKATIRMKAALPPVEERL